MTLQKRWARATLHWTERVGGITINNIKLGASERDRSLFAQGLVLMREIEDTLPDEEAKEAFRASSQTITDAEGNSHIMTVSSLRALLIAYGSAYQAMWTAANSPE